MSYKANTTRQMAKTLFPTEKWQRYCKGVYIAKSRLPVNKVQEQTLKKEISMSRLLARNGYIVYLLPEKSTKKTADALVNGVTTEFKEITGNIKTLGYEYKKALKQGQDVFIKAIGKSKREVIKKLVGETLACQQPFENTTVYLCIQDDILEVFEMKDLIKTRL